MAPPSRYRADPAASLIGDWVPAEYVPSWGQVDQYSYLPPHEPGAPPPPWTFKKVIRDFGGEQVIAWQRIS